MRDKITVKSVRWLVGTAVIVVALALLIWFNLDAVWAFIDFVWDREAVIAYLDTLGVIGPLVLMGLVGIQVLIPSLPAEPPMIAGAYAYGFASGFLMNWVVSVAVSQAVFALARYAGRPLAERFVPAEMLDKWTRTAGGKGTLFFLLAFVIPPVPSDILIYVAGLSAIEGRRFFVANFFGRMPMIVLLTMVGAYGLTITPAMIVALTGVGILMLVAWLYYVRERPDAQASRIDPSNAGPLGKVSGLSHPVSRKLSNADRSGADRPESAIRQDRSGARFLATHSMHHSRRLPEQGCCIVH